MFTSRAAKLITGLVICTASGCSMCCGVYDYSYPTFGGKIQRADPEYGRVGSIYSDPLADPGVPAITNTQVPVEPRRNSMDSEDDGIEKTEDGSMTKLGGNQNSGQRSPGWR